MDSSQPTLQRANDAISPPVTRPPVGYLDGCANGNLQGLFLLKALFTSKPKNRNHYPGIAGRRRVGVAGPIGGAHLESVGAECQAAIAPGTRAGCEGTPVELAGEGAARFGGREAEARAPA